MDESATQIRIRPAIFTARFMTHTSGKNRIVTQDWIWASRGRISGMNTSGIDTSGIYEFQYLKTVLFPGRSELRGKLMKPKASMEANKTETNIFPSTGMTSRHLEKTKQ